MRMRLILPSLVLLGLIGCSSMLRSPTPSPVPTQSPSPVVIPTGSDMPASPEASLATNIPTVEVITSTAGAEPTLTDTPAPTDTPLPPPPASTPTLLPTLPASTPTSAGTGTPQPAIGSSMIQFLGPGPLSKLVSPFYIYGYAVPGFNSMGTVVLYGEDGRVLTTQRLALYTANYFAWFSWPLSFEAMGAGELGRLTMSTQDEYGRLVAVYSVHLILLPEGNSVVTPPGDLRERCVIDKPVIGKFLSGGTLQVAGKIRPFNSQPLNVELTDRNGHRIGSQLVLVTPAADDSYVPFQVAVPYTIPGGMYARLSVSQADDRISGMMYLYSIEIYLHP
jgi:hypothetical protein